MKREAILSLLLISALLLSGASGCGSTDSSDRGIQNSPNGKFDCSSITKMDDMSKPYQSYCLSEIVDSDQTIPSVTIDNVDCSLTSIYQDINYRAYYHLEISGTATGPVANSDTLNVFYAFPDTVLQKIGEPLTPWATAVEEFRNLDATDWPKVNWLEFNQSEYRRIYQPATTKWTASGDITVYEGKKGVMVVELVSSKTATNNNIIAQAIKEITC